MSKLWIVCGLMFGCVTGAVAAPSAGPSVLASADVSRFRDQALNNLDRYTCPEQASCPSATTDERQNPPIGIEHARKIMLAGHMSARLRHCGLDWRSGSYVRLAREFRDQYRYSDRQMALLSLIHRMSMDVGLEEITKTGRCSDRDARRLKQEVGL
jgi:hypothetical protein